ncbi:MAG: DUF2933 domain-containing protein [Sneathiella sp.]|nr:DUF2933 domain-containing protein [Sneathiella sp.]
MQHDNEHYHKPSSKKHWWQTREGVVLIVFLVFAAFYLITEHTAHLYSALPWLILLACPLLHLFMHRGHNHNGTGSNDKGGAH